MIAEPLESGALTLEGQELAVVPLGHTDTNDTTCLHVPSIGLVIAGDVAYNDVHLYLAESNRESRREWIAALDTIESLRPRAVGATRSRLWKLFPRQWREPSVSPDESRSLNKVRLRQRNEAP